MIEISKLIRRLAVDSLQLAELHLTTSSRKDVVRRAMASSIALLPSKRHCEYKSTTIITPWSIDGRKLSTFYLVRLIGIPPR
jgi:hypothetical protein